MGKVRKRSKQRSSSRAPFLPSISRLIVAAPSEVWLLLSLSSVLDRFSFLLTCILIDFCFHQPPQTRIMSAPIVNNRWRNNAPFSRDSPSPSPTPLMSTARPKPITFSSSPSMSSPLGHNRNQSFSPLGSSNLAPSRATTRPRSSSNRSSNQASSTFAPTFIKTEEAQREAEQVRGIEGENDFSGRRYVWVRDPQVAFVRGWVVEDLAGDKLLVQCDDGTVSVLELPQHFGSLMGSFNSNARSARSLSTRSILQSLTRQGIWLN